MGPVIAVVNKVRITVIRGVTVGVDKEVTQTWEASGGLVDWWTGGLVDAVQLDGAAETVGVVDDMPDVAEEAMGNQTLTSCTKDQVMRSKDSKQGGRA
jgi:hypothetical protein